MKIFHLHLGYGQCNAGDRWLAIGAKNLMVKYLGVKLADIYERDIYESCGKNLSWDELIEAINRDKYDLVFIGGGGWLGDSSPLWWGEHWAWYDKLKLPYVVYGVGYNAPRSHDEIPKKYFVEQINNLKGTQKNSLFFAVRADGTKEKLENLELGFETMECPDPAFFIEKDKKDRILNEKYVIFNIAGDATHHRYNANKVPSEVFCRSIHTLAKFFIGKGYKIYFMKHVPSDGLCFNFLDWNPKVTEILDWGKVLENGLNYYQHAKMVIGMRGHAQVVPIAFKVPLISIATTHKNTGLMEKLGIPEYNIDVADKDLVEKIEKLVNKIEDNPTKLIKQYSDILEKIEKETQENFKVILERLKKTKIMDELQKIAGDYNLTTGPYNENFDEEYWLTDFKGKTILDIGADYGSTAMFFLRKGAKKVIAIEPNPKYFEVLDEIGKKVKEIVPLKFKITCGYNVSNLIKEYSPDIVKMDCDGCEVLLLQMIDADIKMVKDWIMELHSINVFNSIKDLFTRNGFELKYKKFDSVSQWAWVVWFSRRS